MNAGAGNKTKGNSVICNTTGPHEAVCQRPSGHEGEHDSCDYGVPEELQGGLVWLP